MWDALKTIAAGSGIAAIVIGGFYGFLCLVGLIFIEGNHTEIEDVTDNCYTITEYHENWYPSSSEIVKQELYCDGELKDTLTP